MCFGVLVMQFVFFGYCVVFEWFVVGFGWCFQVFVEYGLCVWYIDVVFLVGDGYGGYVVVDQVGQCVVDVYELVY